MLATASGSTPSGHFGATAKDRLARSARGATSRDCEPGQVIGKSDKIGAYPTTTPYTPDDIGATVYHVLGVDPASEVRDRQDRPVQLNRGQVMEALFTGAAG